MPEFLLATAALVLLTVAVGLLRLLRGPTDADRVMAVQLLGTGTVAVLLLVAAVAYSIAVRLFDAPCSGEFDQLGAATQQCLDRWESVELLPFLPVLPLGLVAFATPTRFWQRWAPMMFLGCLVLLVIVLMPAIKNKREEAFVED